MNIKIGKQKTEIRIGKQKLKITKQKTDISGIFEEKTTGHGRDF